MGPDSRRQLHAGARDSVRARPGRRARLCPITGVSIRAWPAVRQVDDLVALARDGRCRTRPGHGRMAVPQGSVGRVLAGVNGARVPDHYLAAALLLLVVSLS